MTKWQEKDLFMINHQSAGMLTGLGLQGKVCRKKGTMRYEK